MKLRRFPLLHVRRLQKRPQTRSVFFQLVIFGLLPGFESDESLIPLHERSVYTNEWCHAFAKLLPPFFRAPFLVFHMKIFSRKLQNFRFF